LAIRLTPCKRLCFFSPYFSNPKNLACRHGMHHLTCALKSPRFLLGNGSLSRLLFAGLRWSLAELSLRTKKISTNDCCDVSNFFLPGGSKLTGETRCAVDFKDIMIAKMVRPVTRACLYWVMKGPIKLGAHSTHTHTHALICTHTLSLGAPHLCHD
jgi:hypothetical protein